MQEIRFQSLGQEDSLEKKWQPTPVFLSGKSYGQRTLVGYSPWGHRSGHNWATNSFQGIQGFIWTHYSSSHCLPGRGSVTPLPWRDEASSDSKFWVFFAMFLPVESSRSAQGYPSPGCWRWHFKCSWRFHKSRKCWRKGLREQPRAGHVKTAFLDRCSCFPTSQGQTQEKFSDLLRAAQLNRKWLGSLMHILKFICFFNDLLTTSCYLNCYNFPALIKLQLHKKNHKIIFTVSK